MIKHHICKASLPPAHALQSLASPHALGWTLISLRTVLQARADKGELFACPEVDGFFDDREHYAVIK